MKRWLKDHWFECGTTVVIFGYIWTLIGFIVAFVRFQVALAAYHGR